MKKKYISKVKIIIKCIFITLFILVGILAVIIFRASSDFNVNDFTNNVAISENFNDISDQKEENIAINQLLVESNKKRSENGLNTLILKPELNDAARNKADDMIMRNYWEHNSPDDVEPWKYILGAGYQYEYAGENLAKGYYSAKEVLSGWMLSQSHRENLLNPNYSEVGFSIKHAESYIGEDTFLVVQMLASPDVDVSLKSPNSNQNNIISEQYQINDNTPVHCNVNEKCGGGTTPLTNLECKNSTCCQINDRWILYTDKNKCLQDQANQ